MIKWQKDFQKARALTFSPVQNKFLTTPLLPVGLVF